MIYSLHKSWGKRKGVEVCKSRWMTEAKHSSNCPSLLCLIKDSEASDLSVFGWLETC